MSGATHLSGVLTLARRGRPRERSRERELGARRTASTTCAPTVTAQSLMRLAVAVLLVLAMFAAFVLGVLLLGALVA